MLRRWRGRFGISAPQVAIRTRVPWRLRVVGMAALMVLLLVLVVWVFDFGRQIAGANRNEIVALRADNAALAEEVTRLRGLLAASANDLQIEQAAQKELKEKYGALVKENARLKEELAVLERLSRAKKK